VAFPHEAIVMVHLEERLHLRHGVEIDADQNE